MNLNNIVNKMLEALSQRDLDTLTSYFAEDFVFELVPEHVAIKGKKQWYDAATEFVNWVKEGRKELLRTCQQDNIVWVERIDHWKIQGQWIALPIMSIIEFSQDNKVVRWREYHTLEYRKQFENSPETGFGH